MLDKIIIKNIGSLFSIQLAGYFIPLISVPYLVRVLGVEGYGYLGFSLAIAQYVNILVSYGFDLSATSVVAKYREDRKKISLIFWNILLIRVVNFFIASLGILVLATFIPEVQSIVFIIYACTLGVLGGAIFPQWLFQGKEQLGVVSTCRVSFQIITLPILFVAVKGEQDVLLAAIIGSLPMVGTSLVAFFLVYRRQWVEWVSPNIGTIKNQLIDGWHIFLSTAAVSLYTTSVTVILGIISGPISVGYFTAADRIVKAILGLYSVISNAFYPRVNSVVSESRDRALQLIKKLLRLLFAVALVSSVSTFLLADYVVTILFGDGFEETTVLLKIMCWLPIIICLSNVFGVQILIPFGYKEVFSRGVIVSGTISFTFLVPLVVYFDATGAAFSVLLTEILVTILMFGAVKKLNIIGS